MKLRSPAAKTPNKVIHTLRQILLNFSVCLLGCKIALNQDLSTGAILIRKHDLGVPNILSHRPNCMKLEVLRF